MSDQISAGELAQMRAVAELTYPDTAIVRRVTYASNGQGGQTPTWSSAGTCLCRLSPDAQLVEETGIGGRLLTREYRVITLPATTDVNETDRLQLAGVDYEVCTIAPRTCEITRRVEAVEVD